MDFRETNLEASWDQNVLMIDINNEKQIIKINLIFLQTNGYLEGSGGRTWEEKSITNPSKNEIHMGRRLDIDFKCILVDIANKWGEKTEPESIDKRIKNKPSHPGAGPIGVAEK